MVGAVVNAIEEAQMFVRLQAAYRLAALGGTMPTMPDINRQP